MSNTRRAAEGQALSFDGCLRFANYVANMSGIVKHMVGNAQRP